MRPERPAVGASPSSRFEDWQLADYLASCAERCVCDAFTSSVTGTGPRPTGLQLEISHALRIEAKRLLIVALKDIPVLSSSGSLAGC